MTLEVIAFNAEEVLTAQAAGANQIELVNDLKEDGLTPSFEIIKEVMEVAKIPIHVMVRPTNTFQHSEKDMKKIIEAIEFCKKQGVKGVVFGSLNKDGTINESQLKRVIDASGEMRVIFHRAIDFSSDYMQAAVTLNKFDIYCVLTSGGPGKAVSNVKKINSIKDIANYKILQGSGINSENIKELYEATGINMFHIGTSARLDMTQNTPVWASRVVRHIEVLND